MLLTALNLQNIYTGYRILSLNWGISAYPLPISFSGLFRIRYSYLQQPFNYPNFTVLLTAPIFLRIFKKTGNLSACPLPISFSCLVRIRYYYFQHPFTHYNVVLLTAQILQNIYKGGRIFQLNWKDAFPCLSHLVSS